MAFRSCSDESVSARHCLEKRYILPRKKKNDILLLFFKCNNKCFVLYESHGFTFSSTYIMIQSFFPDTDVNMSAMVMNIHEETDDRNSKK